MRWKLFLLGASLIFGFSDKTKINGVKVCDMETGLNLRQQTRVIDIVNNRLRTILPSKTAQLFGQTSPTILTRHHIIPFNILKDFALTVMEHQLDNVDHLRNHFNHIVSTAARQNANLFPTLKSKDVEGLNDNEKAAYLLYTIFQWLPGNIFYGPPPNLRNDDPKEDFESNSITIVGEEHFRLLLNLNNLFLDFISKPNLRNVATYDSIMTSIETLANMQSFDFNSNQWDHNAKHYWIKNTRTSPASSRLSKRSAIHDDNHTVSKRGAVGNKEKSCYASQLYDFVSTK